MKLSRRIESVKPAILRSVTAGTLSLPSPLLRALGRARLAPVDGKRLDLQLAAMLQMGDLVGKANVTAETPDAARREMRESVQIASSPALEHVRSRDFDIPGPGGKIPARFYEPDEISPTSPLVMYIHGGGWVTGDLETHDSLCRVIASKANVRVVAIDYRLSPEHRFPAAPDDCLAAFRWLAEHAEEFGTDAARIAVMGDSAGGNLSAVIGWETRNEAVKPALQVLLYPGTSGLERAPSRSTFGAGYLLSQDDIDWFLGHYMSDGMDPEDPRFAPLFAKDLKGAPRALVYTAGFDPLLDEGKAYATRLRNEGVDTHYECFDSLIHGFAVIDGICDAAAVAVDRICEDVGRAFRDRAHKNASAHAQDAVVTG